MTEAVKQVADGLSPLQHELLARADSIMASISTTVDKASNFAAEQVPDVALQYVAFGRASTTAYVAIGLLILLVGLYLVVRIGLMNSRKMPDVYTGSWAEERGISLFFGIFISIVGAVTFLSNLSIFLMVWFAPKVWLLQEIVHLVKR